MIKCKWCQGLIVPTPYIKHHNGGIVYSSTGFVHVMDLRMPCGPDHPYRFAEPAANIEIACRPAACQCSCHTTGLTANHLVACCNGLMPLGYVDESGVVMKDQVKQGDS